MRKPLIVLAALVAALVPGVGAYAGPSGPIPPYAAPAGLTATEVSFTNGDTVLHGSVVRLAAGQTAAGRTVKRPGIVLVHGSGNAVRPQLAQEAEVFARAGIVTLIYDKRSDYDRSHRDYGDLANDALAGVALLRGLPDVDPGKVGLWGLSEGGWVAPLAASRSGDVAFLITIGGSGLSPARTQAWNLNNRLAGNGVADATAAELVASGMGLAVGLDQFPEAKHDPVEVLRAIHQPVLAIWGERDLLVPPAESAAIFRRELIASPSVSIRILPGSSHAARVTTNGFDRVGGPTVGGFVMGELSPGYADLMTSWIAAGYPSTIDAVPAQRTTSAAIEPVGVLGFGLFALLILVLLSWPVTAVVRRLRGRRGRPAGAVPARLLVLAGLAATLLGTAYAVFVVASGGTSVHAAFLGQPLVWLLARGCLAVALTCGVLVALAFRSAPSVRLGAVLAGGVLLIPYALGLGLLLP
ncbi:MAG: prolyl oligopeptidase family serine peptidase [Hamadaea sp.]|nr:prolyl oligopeptidase family serine peptidase [Hamadaea sp.]NUR47024.1 prolyl oligopeptidase family serine peptidase [Hamadaea sp.]NUT06557.1 prolyl oligopeptidase family serine peptidase [Hamadaea sp.]